MAEADEVLAELVLGELEGRRVEECLDGKDEGGERGPLGGDRLPAGVSLSPRVRAERVERVAQLGIEPVGVGLRPLQGSATPTGHDRLIANLEHRGSRDHTTHSCSIEHMFAQADTHPTPRSKDRSPGRLRTQPSTRFPPRSRMTDRRVDIDASAEPTEKRDDPRRA